MRYMTQHFILYRHQNIGGEFAGKDNGDRAIKKKVGGGEFWEDGYLIPAAGAKQP